MEGVNFHYGTPGLTNIGGHLVPIVSSPKFGIRTAPNTSPIPLENGPDTVTIPAPVLHLSYWVRNPPLAFLLPLGTK
jgi:hypothetical protein